MTIGIPGGSLKDWATAITAIKDAVLQPFTLDLNLLGGDSTGIVLSVARNLTVRINGSNGTIIFGNSPALTVVSGNVVVTGVTFTNATDTPTILVQGGNLVLRNDIIQETTGGSQAAVSITGGTVDLGTIASHGGNILNVNGNGEFIQNTTTTSVPNIGDTFEVNGNPSLSITGVSPGAGPPRGATQFTITGTGFVSGLKVLVGGVPTTVITSTPTTVIALSPHLPVGAADVTVVNPDGEEATAPNAFLVTGVVVDQEPNSMTIYPISSGEEADDFTLTAPSTIAAVQFWAVATKYGPAEPLNGFLPTFSGTMSWAIRANSTNLPGAILFSGSSANIVPVQTAGRLFGGLREYTIGFNLATPVNLTPGTYWFELHEGPTLNTDTTPGGADIEWEGAVPNSTSRMAGATLGGAFSPVNDQLAFQLFGTPSGVAAALPASSPAVPVVNSSPDLKVLNADGQQGVLPPNVAFSMPPPVIYAINANAGEAGDTVRIYGVGFQPGAQVFFGGTLVTLAGTPTDTLLTVVIPRLRLGITDVKVVNPDGQQALATGAFFVLPDAFAPPSSS
jgi:hypothetical protein